jgi:hypothetical protein
MDTFIFEAQITLKRKLPAATGYHYRRFKHAEHAIQTFQNVVGLEFGGGVSFVAKTEEVYDIRYAFQNDTKVAEMRVLKVPVYETARASLEF